MDTVNLGTRSSSRNIKLLTIQLRSGKFEEAVSFDVGTKDTIKIKVKGTSDYPIIIKQARNISLNQINDSLFYMHVLDSVNSFEVWQDYGQGKVVAKQYYTADSVRIFPYDGVRIVGRVRNPF